MNAVVAEKESSDVVEFRAPGPGERLRNARVVKDLDIRKIAEKLHLTTDMVDSIERDDYAELPARVFVRGYIRNYARLVDLPMDSVVAQFDELWPEDEAKVKIDRAPRLAADPRPGSRWSSAVTWLLLLVSIALFLMWWHGYLDRFTQNDGDATDVEQQLPVAGSEPPAALVLPPAGPEEPVPQRVVEGSGLIALPPASNVDSAQQAVTSEPAAAVVEQNDAPVETPASLQDIVEALEQSEVADPSQAAESAQAAATENEESQATIPEPVVEQGVMVRFNEDCWVDIRGANRSFKLFGTMRKGTEKRLEGNPPYKFVLGNASAVEVLVNGKPFDLGAHTKDNVARFSLSP